MNEQFRDDGLQAMWQSQPREERVISLEQVRTHARRLDERVGRRNRREYIAAAVVVGVFGAVAWFAPSITVRSGAALLVAATVFIVNRLRVHGSARPLPAELADRSALDFHRAQLVRQRDLLQTVWLWYLLPLVPGMAMLLIGVARADPERMSRIVAIGIGTGVLMIGGHVVNRRSAARIQQYLDRLNGHP
jgi:hypothetical protein